MPGSCGGHGLPAGPRFGCRVGAHHGDPGLCGVTCRPARVSPRRRWRGCDRAVIARKAWADRRPDARPLTTTSVPGHELSTQDSVDVAIHCRRPRLPRRRHNPFRETVLGGEVPSGVVTRGRPDEGKSGIGMCRRDPARGRGRRGLMRAARGLAWLVCGRWTKWIVLALWVVILALAGPLAGKLTGVEKNDNSAWLPGSAEATKVLDQQHTFQPQDTLPAIVAYERKSGLTDADVSKAAADARTFAGYANISGKVLGPIRSTQDGTTPQAIQTIVPIAYGTGGWEAVGATVEQIRGVVQAGIPDGLTVHITGPGGVAADQQEAFKGIDGRLLYSTLAVVVVILLLTYRSPVLWLLPVISAAGALTASQAVIYLLAKHAGLTVNAQSAGFLTVLVFGAGTDYALLLVARYREELRRHTDRHEAMALALHRAGPAIIASAATVAVGMLCLTVAEMNSTKGLGPVNAIGIGIGLLSMLTLLPALLVTFGRWIFWPARPAFGTSDPTGRGLWARVGNGVARRARPVWIITAVALGALAFGVTGMKADGLTTAQSFINKPDSVVGADVLAAHFPPGGGSPVVVIGDAAAADQIRSAVAATDGIADASQPQVKDGLAYITATL